MQSREGGQIGQKAKSREIRVERREKGRAKREEQRGKSKEHGEGDEK